MKLLAEWAPCQAVWLAWPFPDSDWADNYEAVVECYWGIVTAIAQYAEVWILVHPSLDEQDFAQKLSTLPCGQAVRWRNDVTYNDTWIRDYGPLSRSSGFLAFGFNGWGGKYDAECDNAVASGLSHWLNDNVAASEWVVEGGALDINERGVLLANANCVVDEARNPHKTKQDIERHLAEQLGITAYAWLNNICLTGDDTDGHIDTIARFVADDCVVYTGRNPTHHDAAVLELLHAQLSELACKHGWTLCELPTPVVRSELDGRLLPATYANFLICNGAILFPVYGCPEDAEAIRIVECAFPDYAICPVPAAPLLEQHGSLHCATMQVAKQSLTSLF